MFYDDQVFEVRSEVATLLCRIYEHQTIPPTDLFIFYDVMSYAATEDPHAEVKIRSLHFWRKVIENKLTSQGMLDGEFPHVIFSKERRKIIVLNYSEIVKRLFKVLDDLSEDGCLAVLALALEENHEAVMNMNSMNTFIQMLKQYKIAKSIDSDCETKIGSTEDSNSNESGICSKILGRKILSPTEFLCSLNKHLFMIENKRPLSPYKRIEFILQDILNQR